MTATLNTLGPAINVANVEGLPGDTDQTNNNSTATATVTAVVDLSVVKTESAATLSPGGSETYTIVVANHSTRAGTNVTVTDRLPPGVTFVSDSSTPAGVTFNNSQAGNATNPTVTATIGTLAANTSETLTIVVTAPGANTAATLVNTASVTGNETDNVPSNNTSSVTATVTATTTSIAQLTITKAGPANDPAGGVITYTITVSNIGSASATGATVTDVLPAGLTNITATDAAGTTTVTGTTVTDVLGPLGP